MRQGLGPYTLVESLLRLDLPFGDLENIYRQGSRPLGFQISNDSFEHLTAVNRNKTQKQE